MQAPPPTPPPAPKSKKTCLWLGCGGCLGLVVLGAGGLAFFVFVIMGAIKNAEPYKTVMTTVKESPAVQAELGTPIEAHWNASLNVSANANGGTSSSTADFTIPVSGPKGSGSVRYVAAKTSDGPWTPSTFTVTVDGSGKVINLGQ
jgi:hypothetical protein